MTSGKTKGLKQISRQKQLENMAKVEDTKVEKKLK